MLLCFGGTCRCNCGGRCPQETWRVTTGSQGSSPDASFSGHTQQGQVSMVISSTAGSFKAFSCRRFPTFCSLIQGLPFVYPVTSYFSQISGSGAHLASPRYNPLIPPPPVFLSFVPLPTRTMCQLMVDLGRVG